MLLALTSCAQSVITSGGMVSNVMPYGRGVVSNNYINNNDLGSIHVQLDCAQLPLSFGDRHGLRITCPHETCKYMHA